MEENKRLSSHQKSKRAQHMDNKRGAPKIYNTNKDGFKALVLRLTTVVPPNSRDLNDILPSPPPRALHPQPVTSNTARFPPLPYRYLTLPVRNISAAALSNTQRPPFLPPLPPQYQSPPPVNISAAELSNVQPPSSTTASPFLPPLPPQYSSVPTGINDVNISTAELSNFQPLPSGTTFLPPLPPQYQSVPDIINDVNISAAELSNVQPPLSPREQESVDDSVAAFMQHFESCMVEDDSTEQHFPVWSPFHDTVMISDEEQQQQQQPAENVPSLAPMNLPSENPDWPNSTYDLPPPTPTTLPSTNLDWSSNFTYDSQLPSMNLPDGMFNYPHHLLSENVPAPIPVTSPYENIPPPAILQSEMVPPATLPFGSYQSSLPSADISPPIPTDLSSWSRYWQNHPNDQRPENILPPVPMDYSSSRSQLGWSDSQNNQLPEMVPPLVPTSLAFGTYENDLRSQMYIAQSGFATVPSWSLDWDSYPSVLRSGR